MRKIVFMGGPIAGVLPPRAVEITRELVVWPLKSENGIRFDYEMAMGRALREPALESHHRTAVIADNQVALDHHTAATTTCRLVDERGAVVA